MNFKSTRVNNETTRCALFWAENWEEALAIAQKDIKEHPGWKLESLEALEDSTLKEILESLL